MPPNVENLIALPPGRRLGEYRIERCLGSGGFGITYSAIDEHLDRRVAIKEFLPKSLAMRDANDRVTVVTAEDEADFRWGLDRFLDEARALARFDHPNLVGVKRFLEAHGTGYIVMEHVDGEPLSEMLKRKATLTEPEIREHVLPLAAGLTDIHAAGLLHRDIKLSNIVVRADGVPVLIDFGSARLAVNAKSPSLTAVVTPGYAPLEQYSAKGRQLPATDIYALGAVLYRCVTGVTPRDATERALEDRLAPVAEAADGVYSDGLLTAIDAALAMRIDDRPHDVGAFLKLAPACDNKQEIADALGAAEEAYNRGEYEIALREFRRLATLGHTVAQYVLGSMYYRGEGEPEDEAEAIQWLTCAAEQGHADAQCELGVMNYFGDGVPEDHVRAAHWFERAAEQGDQAPRAARQYRAALHGDAEAQWKLGSMYTWYEEGAPKNHIQAVHWYSLAAEQGNAAAQRYMDEVHAVERYMEAAEGGDAKAQYELGNRYEIGGEGTPQDPARAAQWYTDAADQGHTDAQLQLGDMYCTSWGVAEDRMLAAQWYERAAEQGNAVAQYKLGNMYRRGEGVPEDLAQAVHLFTRSAEQGNPNAQYSLGQMYINGAGVRADNVQAYAWTNLAAGRVFRFTVCGQAPDSVRHENDIAARLLDKITENLSATELAAAKKLSDNLEARIQSSR